MYTVLKTRKGIPFFCQKSEADFRQDPYERYHDMVLRQTALHLADELWGGYSFQLLLDWLLQETEAIFVKTKQQPTFHFVEIGCGVGRLIGTLAQHYPNTNCWGIDYSYQMLKRAKEYWLSDQSIEFDWSERGFSPITIEGKSLSNLQFGLAHAEALPFADQSQDLLFHSFLLDRLTNPLKALKEMKRVLKPNGRLLMVSPLNFQQATQWASFHPTKRLKETLTTNGFIIEDWKEHSVLEEPIDARGNFITWKCVQASMRIAHN